MFDGLAQSAPRLRIDAGPLRRTSSSATSIGRRPTTRRSIERDTNRAPATGIGTRPGTATTATDGTCVVKPRRCAAATSAGPAPGPATSNAMSAGRGAAIPNLVFGPFQYKPLRTRSTSPSAARREKAHSTRRRRGRTDDDPSAASATARRQARGSLRTVLSDCARSSRGEIDDRTFAVVSVSCTVSRRKGEARFAARRRTRGSRVGRRVRLHRAGRREDLTVERGGSRRRLGLGFGRGRVQ